MYLHIGQNRVIRQQDVVGIFDLDNTTVSRFTREFLTKAERAGQTEPVSEELPKSFIVCSKTRKTVSREPLRQTVYIAQMAPRTLEKRTWRTQLILTEADNREESGTLPDDPSNQEGGLPT